MAKEYYPKSKLAQQTYEILSSVQFGADFDMVPIVNYGLASHVDTALKHLDHNAKIRPERGFGSVFDGLDFDAKHLRSQAFAIYRKRDERPVAVSAFLIAPASWIRKQRYFERIESGVAIRNFRAISGGLMPEYLIMPGWTYVDKEFLLRFALPGVRAITKISEMLRRNAPENTWMMEIPRVTWPRQRWIDTETLAKSPLGTKIFQDQLPFSLDILGINDPGANASVKMSRLLGLLRVSNIASVKTLGPVFAQHVR